MKVTLLKQDELLVEPETDFEAQWMSKLGLGDECDLMAFHKLGLSVDDYVGIKIQPKKKGGV